MNKWLIVFALLLVTTAASMAGYRWQERRLETARATANRVVVQSCLSQMGKAMLLYANEDKGAFSGANQPTTNPSTQPANVQHLSIDAADAVLYIDLAQTAATTQPATTQPSARSVMIRGCSKNHDQDAQNVLYADDHPEFQAIDLASQNDNLFSLFGVQPPSATQPTSQPATQPVVDLWPLLRAGQCVIVLRHARTVGSGSDPANFNLADRSTQRNLSDDGMKQSKRIGEIFKQRGIPVGQVLSSEYFRCRETAEHAFSQVKLEPALNSLGDGEEQVGRLRWLMQAKPTGGNTVLVTHQASLKATTNLVPEMGDAVVVQPNGDGTFRTAGVLKIDDPAAKP